MRETISKETSTRHKGALQILQTATSEDWPFQRLFSELKALHLSRYEVDTVSGDMTFYWSDGTETVRTYEKPTFRTLGKEFDGNAIKTAIAQSRKKTIDYDRFLESLSAAGCKEYEVNFRSDQVVYYGVNENNKIAEAVGAK